MSYKDKPQIKLYKYQSSSFVLQAVIDDFQECSFENNRFSAGQFSISINYNIPNALLFERGLFVQFGNNPYYFGEIINITDSIGADGKGSQIRNITGYDARYIFKRRIIKSLNNENTWTMTAKGELCIRNLIADQCGENAETKRQLPIENTIPTETNAIGSEYSVSESFSNLYEVLCTIATQSEIGWRLNFNGSKLTLECYEGTDRSATVRFDTSYDSLSNGQFTDSAESYANSIYVGGKGTGSERDIYEGENGSPTGLDRYEAWDNQSSMTTEEEYEAEAVSMLTQYGQTLSVSGQGLAKCPYVYGEEYEVGDSITISFSGKSAVVQILSVTEHWSWGAYDLQFSFGKPQNDLSQQLQLILKQIQKASDKTTSTSDVKYYTIPDETEMPSADVIYDRIGFIGTCASGGSTFQLYLDNEGTGAKTYHVYFKQLEGGSLTLTTGKSGATDLTLNSGTYVAIIFVDANGNITNAGATPTSTIASGNSQPATSNGVASAISTVDEKINQIEFVENADINSLYPSENNKMCCYYGFMTNIPVTYTTVGMVKAFRIVRVNGNITEIYQEFETYGVSNIGTYAPVVYTRYGYYSGSGSGTPTWSSWVKLIRNYDITETVADGNSNPVTSNAVSNALSGLIKTSEHTINLSSATWFQAGTNGIYYISINPVASGKIPDGSTLIGLEFVTWDSQIPSNKTLMLWARSANLIYISSNTGGGGGNVTIRYIYI